MPAPSASVNFCGLIAKTARRLPDRIIIERVTRHGVEATTFSGLMEDARQFAGWLRHTGVTRGDRAALLADNSADWIAAYLGTLWLAAVAVPLDTAYSAEQVRIVLESSGARVLFTTPRYLETARAATQAGHGADHAVVVVLLTGESGGGSAALADRAAIRAAGLPGDIDTAGATDAAVLLYTSGTTSDPKGVVLTHGNLEAEREAVLAIAKASDQDVVLGVLPLFHALAQMANLLLPLAVGARVVFLDEVSSSTLIEALNTRGITLFACVPQFFYLIHQGVMAEVAKAGRLRGRLFRLLVDVNVGLRDRLGWNPGRTWFRHVHRRLGPSMRLHVTGGSRFDEAIGRDLYGLGLTILNAYGLTESSGAATLQRPGDRFTTSVGPPLEGVDVRIAAAQGSADAEDHGDGEVLIRGPIVMREYFGRPDATREAIDADGWLHTGDLGRLDQDGRLYITGRRKEIIVLSSGKNLYPEEIEAHYLHSPFIAELCVLGLAKPGEPAAERLFAVIVPHEAALRERGIVNVGDRLRFEVETASASLPPHKRILQYELTNEPLPRTTTGKLKRRDIERRVTERTARGEKAREAPLVATDREWLADERHAALAGSIGRRLGRTDVRPGANLELDLGLDSMERVELLTTLEHEAGASVPAEARAAIFTVKDLVEAVIAHRGTGSAEGTAQAGSGQGTASTSDDRAGGTTDDRAAWQRMLAAPVDPVVDRLLARSRRLAAIPFFAVLVLLLAIARLLVRVRITGRDEVRRPGAFLVCPNHQTFLDGAFIAAALPFATLERIFFVGAAEFFESPPSRWFAHLIGLVPIDPDSHLVDAMQAGAAGLRRGKVLLLFPEGERTIDGEIKKFRKGAAILAGEVGVPIVPAAIDGLYPVWPRGEGFQWRALWPPRRRIVRIAFGDPVDVTAGEETTVMDRVRAAVEALRAR